MHLRRSIGVAALSVSALALVAASSPKVADVHRIRAHFDSVLVELGNRDVSGLTVEQRAHRVALVATLTAYRDRGVFPHNYDFPGRAVPYFVDRKTGTLCAVANLLASTGRRDIVERVAHSDNNVWVAQLAGDTALAGWLDANGLSLAEAARIQVPYTAPVSKAEEARNAAFIVLAPTALVASTVTSVWNAFGNADGHRRAVNAVGLTSGIVTATAGMLLTKVQMDPAVLSIAAASTAIGGVSIALSTRGIARHRSIVAAERDADRQRAIGEATISPVVTSNGAAGVGVSIRF